MGLFIVRVHGDVGGGHANRDHEQDNHEDRVLPLESCHGRGGRESDRVHRLRVVTLNTERQCQSKTQQVAISGIENSFFSPRVLEEG